MLTWLAVAVVLVESRISRSAVMAGVKAATEGVTGMAGWPRQEAHDGNRCGRSRSETEMLREALRKRHI